MAEKTVKVHRGRLMQKLGVTSVAELVQLVQRAEVLRRSEVRPKSNVVPVKSRDNCRRVFTFSLIGVSVNGIPRAKQSKLLATNH